MMIDEKNKNPTMTANPILLQKKYARVIECFAKQQGLSLDEALGLFYHSEVHQLMRDGVSDMHCMSDLYCGKKTFNSLANDRIKSVERFVTEEIFCS